MPFVLAFTGPQEFLVLLFVLTNADAFSPPTVCICQPLVEMSQSFVLCCSVVTESLPWNDLETTHAVLLQIFCLKIPPKDGAFRKSAS